MTRVEAPIRRSGEADQPLPPPARRRSRATFSRARYSTRPRTERRSFDGDRGLRDAVALGYGTLPEEMEW